MARAGDSSHDRLGYSVQETSTVDPVEPGDPAEHAIGPCEPCRVLCALFSIRTRTFERPSRCIVKRGQGLTLICAACDTRIKPWRRLVAERLILCRGGVAKALE